MACALVDSLDLVADEQPLCFSIRPPDLDGQSCSFDGNLLAMIMPVFFLKAPRYQNSPYWGGGGGNYLLC